MSAPERQLLPIASASESWRWLRGELGRRKGLATLTLLVGLIAAAAAVVPVYVFGVLVDRVREGAPASTIVGVVAVITAAAIVAGALTGLGSYLIARLGEGTLARLRERVVARALRLPIPTVERVGKGDLLSRVGDDVSVIGKAVADVVPGLVSALLLVVLSMVAMVGIDWRLGLAGMVALPMYALALRWYLPRSGPLYAEERVAMGRRSQALISSMQGVRTVRAYGLEDRHLADIDRASAEARDVAVGVFGLFTRFAGRGNRAEFVGLAVILAVGFALVKQDVVTVGQTTTAALLFHRLFNPIGTLLFTFDEVQSAGASLARLVGVLRIPESDDEGRTTDPADASLELVDVRHGYDDDHEVLHGVSVRIEPGERVALVGSTGAGKTTLAALAAGSLLSTSGAVRLGGVPIADLGDRLRRHVAIVSQEVHVFAGPLIEDLRLARPDATVDDVTAALDAVGALVWVRALDAGLDTVVGEGGHALTAAQAQELALARLVLADPPVAVLDEATAEAGSAGARELERAADAATRGRTTLVVAHRLTQAAAADRVVVLEHGRIVEQGTPAELVSAGGRYAQLWAAWEGAGSGEQLGAQGVDGLLIDT
ncbi:MULTISPECIES: ABC transporter ATP-binding protein [unclassified Rhodococcus (in: high G+C Gram-positive bacteria)]|uniref:ABC transporter ATP-binding protein n=1 Tax=unclassified Rhodococcus (in: high G+C Gram-positive bacteria) TaxID=192944 RepID=UPI000E0AA230|nr:MULTISPECIES: ABC transporter ATP-binding protein [unclassified Rhodococcus (in: high G+C Gram-positive bacteria)]QKT10100.1 ABC transporter ATP-binding protein [Rhodococcus sp. W8901]RDI30219.1 ATP-binding cassette subfamily C protein [Rhodococcus sp. AG1013]